MINLLSISYSNPLLFNIDLRSSRVCPHYNSNRSIVILLFSLIPLSQIEALQASLYYQYIHTISYIVIPRSQIESCGGALLYHYTLIHLLHCIPRSQVELRVAVSAAALEVRSRFGAKCTYLLCSGLTGLLYCTQFDLRSSFSNKWLLILA